MQVGHAACMRAYRNTGSCRVLLMCGYLADELRHRVRAVAELSAHLQVADTANGVPELCQAVGTHHQQCHVGSDVVELQEM